MTKPVALNLVTRSPNRKKNRFTAVIETPKGSRNKFDWDPELSGFVLGKQLPAGTVFPYDFGFIPSTLGDDGDPIDVVVLLDSPTFPGCLTRVRLVGVIDAEQSDKKGRMVRNPRLIGVATKSVEHEGIKALSDVPPNVMKDIERFFIGYNATAGKRFQVVGTYGRRKAVQMAMRSMQSPGRPKRAGASA